MWPCRRPAKKARIGLRDGERPPTSPSISPVRRWISGKETSLEGLNPSEVLALHNTLMDLLNKFGTKEDARGPCRQNVKKTLYQKVFK